MSRTFSFLRGLLHTLINKIKDTLCEIKLLMRILRVINKILEK